MIIDVDKFEWLLRKATLNYIFDFVQLNISPEKISTKMTHSAKDAIVIFDIKNEEIFSDIKDDYQFNFSDPSQTIVPFINLVAGEKVNAEIKPDKIILKSGSLKSNIHFSIAESSKIFGADSPKAGIEYFIKFKIDNDFEEKFSKIKRIGSKFGKIYFNVLNKNLTIETSDKSNKFSNSLKFDLCSVEKENDFSMLFDYRNFVSLMSVLDSKKEYYINLAYLDLKGLGMLYLESKDLDEKFFLLSKKE